jgi:hypothetical protein
MVHPKNRKIILDLKKLKEFVMKLEKSDNSIV